MNILISGGFGYIGSYMISNYLKKGYEIGIISRKYHSYFKYNRKNISIYIVDITKPFDVKLLNKFDIFIHLAGANDILSKNTFNGVKLTVLGTKNCLDFCCDKGIKRFIYFSTSQVYGRYSGTIKENDILYPENDYAITHIFAEKYVEMYSRNKGIEYQILRPANIYGKPVNKKIDRWSLVPNCFCKEAFENQTITLNSSGKQLKDFISLEDLTNITLLLCENFNKFKNNIINLASGKNISILTIAKMVQKIYKKEFAKKCKLKILSNVPRNTSKFSININKIKKLKYSLSTNSSLQSEIYNILKLLREGVN